MDPVTNDVDAFLDEMWRKYSHLAHERVEALEQYVAALRSGQRDDDLRALAQTSAHKLVGALGSYHRPGSEEAGQAEQLIIDGAPVAELERVVGVLRQLIT
jgi:hypothetical protein